MWLSGWKGGQPKAEKKEELDASSECLQTQFHE